ncbi:MAG: uncharacterized protein QG671_222 [Actinomycetota bacterium]|nr:uncharacterized protein [Actinomycetota bacterium]
MIELASQVTYRDRDLTDPERVERFLRAAKVGVVAVNDVDGFPYAVPVNYVWHDGAAWIHGMGSGKRQRLLGGTALGPAKVCFTVFRDDGTVPDPVACQADTAYLSVLVLGVAERVTVADQAAAALQLIVEKFLPERTGPAIGGRLIETYRSALDGNAVAVHRIVPWQITAKQNRHPDGEPGSSS